ncbi:MAG: shikimate dehydrogenase, partial [Bacteroidota bacterium]
LTFKGALILGTGGAAKAVQYVLQQLNMEILTVSRTEGKADLTYKGINQDILSKYKLIVNTTPLGMAPKVDACPDIPYEYLDKNHMLYDLVYNPEKTLFLANGEAQGSAIINGLQMLHLQAEKAWQIWTST